MASVLTLREQAETSEAAQAVGGYDELMRLQEERTAIVRRGKKAKLVQEPSTGRFTYLAMA
jgi:23S rRNA maturation mini-RNase III